MARTLKSFTVIYSSESVEPVKKLVNTFLDTFHCNPELNFDDLFYVGVFCKPETYANYQGWDEFPCDVYIPTVLTSITSTNDERLEFVDKTMNNILLGEEIKPEWMVQVEALEMCENMFAPSTFLYLKPKDEKFVELGERLIEFLYSPNLMTTLLK